MDYIHELRKHLPIVGYGTCGEVNCTSRGLLKNVSEDKCETEVRDEFKFYLAFENSICKEYITEKFYRALESFTVPIVLSGFNGYKHLVPPHSYISADDFRSLKELADYIMYLDTHPDAYLSYFWWHAHYSTKKPFGYTNHVRLCVLCEKLCDPKMPRKLAPDIGTLWNESADCRFRDINHFVHNIRADQFGNLNERIEAMYNSHKCA